MKTGDPAWRVAAFAVLVAASLALPATGQTVIALNPAADAFVTTGPANDLTTSNFGAAGALAISGASATRSGLGANGTFDSVIRFDLATAKASFDLAYGVNQWIVQSITLRLTTSSPNNPIFNDNATGQFGIAWMPNDTWTEGGGMPKSPDTSGITYASLPDFLGSGDQNLGTFTFNVTTSGTDGANSTYALNLAGNGLVSDLLAGQLASLELFAVTGSMSYLFNSGNFTMAARRPVLSITAVAVPEPGTGLMLLTAIGLLGGLLGASRTAKAYRLRDCHSLYFHKYNAHG